MTKHSSKALIFVAALTVLFSVTPSFAVGHGQDIASHSESHWETARDLVEGWLDAVFLSITKTTNASAVGSGGEEACTSGECDEGYPHIDPNGEDFPDAGPGNEIPPDSDPAAERFPHVDPNG